MTTQLAIYFIICAGFTAALAKAISLIQPPKQEPKIPLGRLRHLLDKHRDKSNARQAVSGYGAEAFMRHHLGQNSDEA